ncbi:MAG: hypothetical protein K9G58_02595 [Bacteroidales bacterium]|nr:hypothetical protein [Bacteroidales bacterium]MCF8387583.1 hypothetical protein [Bacteroidales bacterium]MCF8397027.1 hypothetical protein [Bacteroidales bacterium]
MQRVVIDIPDGKFDFFMELFKNLGFKKVKKLSPRQKEYTDGLNEAINQVNEHLDGKIYLPTAKEFLDEV